MSKNNMKSPEEKEIIVKRYLKLQNWQTNLMFLEEEFIIG